MKANTFSYCTGMTNSSKLSTGHWLNRQVSELALERWDGIVSRCPSTYRLSVATKRSVTVTHIGTTINIWWNLTNRVEFTCLDLGPISLCSTSYDSSGTWILFTWFQFLFTASYFFYCIQIARKMGHCYKFGYLAVSSILIGNHVLLVSMQFVVWAQKATVLAKFAQPHVLSPAWAVLIILQPIFYCHLEWLSFPETMTGQKLDSGLNYLVLGGCEERSCKVVDIGEPAF